MATHSRTLPERSKKSGKHTSPPLTNKTMCAQGYSHGALALHPLSPPPTLPPGLEIPRSNDGKGTSEAASIEGRGEKNYTMKDKDDATKTDTWPLLGAAGDPPHPPPLPPGLIKHTHMKEPREGKNSGYSVKVVQLPSKSLEIRTQGSTKQSSSQKLVSLKPTYETSSTGQTVTDTSSTSSISGSSIFEEIRQALGYNQEKFREFQTLSGWYRNGGVSIGHYNSQCEELFGRQWLVIGPQLAKVMPRGECREKLVAYFAPNMAQRNGVSLIEVGNSKKKIKNKKTKKDEDAWMTVGGGVSTRQVTVGRSSKAAISEEEYPSLSTASKLPPQSKVPQHNPWNVQVRT